MSEPPRFTVCERCGKIVMYSVTIYGQDVCEWCAPEVWEALQTSRRYPVPPDTWAEEHQENEDRRRAAQRGVL